MVLHMILVMLMVLVRVFFVFFLLLVLTDWPDVVERVGRPVDNTEDDNSLERRLYYNADVGRPSSERQQEVNRKYVLVAT
jgi:hypothetical protein